MYGKKGSVQNKPPHVLHIGINCYIPQMMTHFKSFLLPATFARREGQTLPFEGRVHAAPALAKNTLPFCLGHTHHRGISTTH